MATCLYDHERWSILDRTDDKVLIWRPGRKERWVSHEAIDQKQQNTIHNTTTN